MGQQNHQFETELLAFSHSYSTPVIQYLLQIFVVVEKPAASSSSNKINRPPFLIFLSLVKLAFFKPTALLQNVTLYSLL